MTTFATVAVVLALVAMVMIHEAGHYVTAKWSGMKVTEFFFGFGPRLWSTRRGETEYGVKALPAGGYVRILGMNSLEQVDAADEPRTYRQAPFGRRLIVVSAGSVTHFLMAIALLWAMFAVVGTTDYARPQPVVGQVETLTTGPSPAQLAGLRVGDRIVSVDGHRISSWSAIVPLIRDSPGRTVTIGVVRSGQDITLHATPVDLSTVKAPGVPVTTDHTGFLGVGPAYPTVRENPFGAVATAVHQFGDTVAGTVTGLGHVFSPHGISSYANQVAGRAAPTTANGQSEAGSDRFVSVYGLVRLASEAAHSGLYDTLGLLVLINVFVGVFNMLPLLPLDGGHFVVAAYEWVRSRHGRRYRVDIRKLMPVTYAVLAVLFVVASTSIYLDIVRPLPNPFQ
ncbi:MAG TPA: M50 family metallopeptidase [Acidimicrobiales bacterium]|nr:M50 family metallopeptidase [Acidimicrobiales bacterium]